MFLREDFFLLLFLWNEKKKKKNPRRHAGYGLILYCPYFNITFLYREEGEESALLY